MALNTLRTQLVWLLKQRLAPKTRVAVAPAILLSPAQIAALALSRPEPRR